MADGHTGLDFTVRTCQLALTAGSLKSWPVTWTRVGYSAIHYTREAGKVQELIPMTDLDVWTAPRSGRSE
jgi:hypothetical protein